MKLSCGAASAVIATLALGCPTPVHTDGHSGRPVIEAAPRADAAPGDVALPMEAELAASDAAALAEDAGSLVRATTEELLSVVTIPTQDGGPAHAEAILRTLIVPIPGRFNQGNPANAHHDITRRACLDGLRGITLQTDEQRSTCHGMENMVPIYAGGDVATAKTCIDVFEFPNRACELPLVWGTPSEAELVCSVQGKRLCKQEEWNFACRGDPEGKADWTYAYGNDLDLTICNMNKPHEAGPYGGWICSAQTAETAWKTCSTDTEPSGSFPKCRSRFGVFDQHGNVAEMMTRKGTDGATYTQLKGSAFFYVDVSRLPTEAQKSGERETYPDHCNYDPRWHVEPIAGSVHSNYHLGFRCCLSL
jgi:sulfatase modifying factor 1